jgi:hypothetical protein
MEGDEDGDGCGDHDEEEGEDEADKGSHGGSELNEGGKVKQ